MVGPFVFLIAALWQRAQASIQLWEETLIALGAIATALFEAMAWRENRGELRDLRERVIVLEALVGTKLRDQADVREDYLRLDRRVLVLEVRADTDTDREDTEAGD